MLAIRMQRTGRKGHAQFRIIVQDSRFSPTSGRVVSLLGSHNPHTKQTTLDKEKAQQYLSNGAQPTDRVAKILKNEGVKLPEWFALAQPNKKDIKNPEKLRRNRPAEPVAETAKDDEVVIPSDNTEAQQPAPNDENTEGATGSADKPAAESVKPENSAQSEKSNEPATSNEE